jgi:hypothetical protein
MLVAWERVFHVERISDLSPDDGLETYPTLIFRIAKEMEDANSPVFSCNRFEHRLFDVIFYGGIRRREGKGIRQAG